MAIPKNMQSAHCSEYEPICVCNLVIYIDAACFASMTLHYSHSETKICPPNHPARAVAITLVQASKLYPLIRYSILIDRYSKLQGHRAGLQTTRSQVLIVITY